MVVAFGRRWGWLVGTGGVFGHRHQGVEGVGLDWFVAAFAAGGGEDLVGDGVEDGGERGAGLEAGTAGGQVPAAFAVAVVPQPPLSMDTGVGGVGVQIAAAVTQAHSSRSSASDTRAANSTSRCSADGSAAPAAAAFGWDSSPRRSAPSTPRLFGQPVRGIHRVLPQR